MSARLDSVAKHLCQYSGWTLANLQIQKMLYLAQMGYMAENNGTPLVAAHFEAWDNGPIIPDLYHKLKAFGASPVRDVFLGARKFRDGDPRSRLLESIYDSLNLLRPATLIELTQWEQGAWAKNYFPGVKGIKIPNDDIIAEARRRGFILATRSDTITETSAFT